MYFVSLFPIKTTLGKKFLGESGWSLDVVRAISTQLSFPPFYEKDWAMGQKVRHWNFAF